MQAFLFSKDMGPAHLQGVDSTSWGNNEHQEPSDLIGIHPRKHVDVFSRFISEKAVCLFSCGLGRLTKGDKRLGRKVYYDSSVQKVTLWITSAVASLLPVASILVLLQLDSLRDKLLTIAAFNLVMSFCLSVFAMASRTEVFAVSAAYEMLFL